jgi:transposase
MGQRRGFVASSSLEATDGVAPMTQVDDPSHSLVAFEQDRTIPAVVEMSPSSWLVSGLVPGILRQPLKKLEPRAEALLHFIE